jgi:hypothetical protein
MRLWLWSGTNERVSVAWLKDQDRADMRDTPIRASIRWPINKTLNEAARWNTQRLRTRAGQSAAGRPMRRNQA